ncbi:MAG: peptidylprolyl isomerase [Myxococcales bacterium]|nr:peptidylprolyl isomerase [Myxococcales bacterium]
MRTAELPIMAGVLVFLLFPLGGCSKNEKTNTPNPSEETAPTSKVEEAPEVTDKKPGQAPDQYAVELDTTKGAIVIQVHRDWSPHGADRFYELVQNGYYDDVAFFRVIGGFMAQVGISGDPALNAKWRENRIPDDPVKGSNTRGTVSFATSGPNSRTTQFFINFVDNSRLDGMGFSPFGKVKDMTMVDALYAGYGEGAPQGRGPSQALLQSQGNTYLKDKFPNLDYIKSAKITE